MLVAFKNELLSNPINRFGGIPGGPSPESIIFFYIYNAATRFFYGKGLASLARAQICKSDPWSCV
jgi:hypothetical protein